MVAGRNPFRSALLAVAVVGLSSAPLLLTAGCSSDGDDGDRREWRKEQRDRNYDSREERRDRNYESREERRERKKLERVLEQQRQ